MAFIQEERKRRNGYIRRIRKDGPHPEDVNTRGILVKLITVEVEDLIGLIRTDGSPREFPYDQLLTRLVWELMDNSSDASKLGIEIGAIEDLVAFLERACRDEARYNRVRYSLCPILITCRLTRGRLVLTTARLPA